MPFPVNVHSLKQNPGQGGPHVNVDTWMQITLWKALFQAYSSSIAQDCGVLHVPLPLSHSLLWLTAPHGSSFEMSCQPQCYQSESEHFHSLYVNWGTQTPLNFSAGGCYSWSTRYFWGSSSNQRSTVSFFRERLFLLITLQFWKYPICLPSIQSNGITTILWIEQLSHWNYWVVKREVS